ncbi:MAG: protein nirF [Gammaproteobacteria bacterium]|nr:protein nirF [Gammaproteobacteria bacterium]
MISTRRGARLLLLELLGLLLFPVAAHAGERGTGDLGIIVERASGSVCIVETTGRTLLKKVGGLGDLSHASAVFSRDQRFAYVFGRDGGLSKVDLLAGALVGRVVQAGNSIGGAISQDGRLVAVANYEPGGVKVFDADTLAPVADMPARFGDQGALSKVVGLVDAPGRRFVYSLYDAGEIWIADFSVAGQPAITRLKEIGKEPYDALITPDGRYYIAGLFGEDGLALVDLWGPEEGARRIAFDYGRAGEERMPVYKMPHLEGWASAGDYLFVPAMGRHWVLVIRRSDWTEVKRIPVRGQPVFAMARPDGRQVWINFALPDNDTVQVVDVKALAVIHELKPGKAVLHMEFTPRGEEVWISARDENKVGIYDTGTFARTGELEVDTPSGIFFSARAHKIGL